MFVLISIDIGDPLSKKGRVGIQMSDLTQAHLCTCPKPGPEFPPIQVHVIVFFFILEKEMSFDVYYFTYVTYCITIFYFKIKNYNKKQKSYQTFINQK
jgi:hypothetical protein